MSPPVRVGIRRLFSPASLSLSVQQLHRRLPSAGKTGQPAKALVLWLFFALAVSFSLTASITRSGGYRDTQVAEAERGNSTARLAKDTYEIAAANRRAECASGRGPKCREAETHLSQARNALRLAAPIRAADPAAERVAALLGVSQTAVALYSPLALPLGLELGGFIFLAIGLGPGRDVPAARAKRAKRKSKANSPRNRPIESRVTRKSDDASALASAPDDRRAHCFNRILLYDLDRYGCGLERLRECNLLVSALVYFRMLRISSLKRLKKSPQ
jgi:hypothetical protein